MFFIIIYAKSKIVNIYCVVLIFMVEYKKVWIIVCVLSEKGVVYFADVINSNGNMSCDNGTTVCTIFSTDRYVETNRFVFSV